MPGLTSRNPNQLAVGNNRPRRAETAHMVRVTMSFAAPTGFILLVIPRAELSAVVGGPELLHEESRGSFSAAHGNLDT